MSATLAPRAPARAEKSSEFSEKVSERSEAMRLVKLAAEPRPVGDTVGAAIGRVAKRLGWSYARTGDIWYGEARRIDWREMDALRNVEQERDKAAERAELRKRLQRLHALRATLQFNDPDFHAADIEAISWLLDHHR